MEPRGAVRTREQLFRAQVVGPEGLGLEVFRRLLEEVGVSVVGDDGPDVIVLVEPTPEHWAAVRDGGAPIVLVAGEEADHDAVVDSVLAGADAVLHCDSEPDVVFDVLTEVSRGGSILHPREMRTVAALARAAGAQPAVVLSRRESEILRTIAEGMAVKQTARHLGISPKTVENLQGRLFRKLGARNRAQAVTRAHALGLL